MSDFPRRVIAKFPRRTYDAIWLASDTFSLSFQGEFIQMTPAEWRILSAIVAAFPRRIDRRELFEHLYQERSDGGVRDKIKNTALRIVGVYRWGWTLAFDG